MTDTLSRGETRLAVTRSTDGGRVSVRHTAVGGPDSPTIRPVVLSTDEEGARVALVPDGALLLAGDDIALAIEVGAGARLTLVEPGGTVAYDMRGGQARWSVDLTLGPGARVVWHGEPFVASAGSQTVRDVRIRLGPGSRLALREVLVLGRHREPPGRLRQRLLVDGASGGPILADGLDIGPMSGRLLLGGRRTVGSVLVVGADVPGGGPGTRFDVEGGATLVRRLADDAHLAVEDQTWRDAVAAVTR